MTDTDWLAQGFAQNRGHLRAVAYRMLRSLAEADDAVQEARLRGSRSGAGGVDNLGAWLTTVVARVCLNALRSRKAPREEALGVHVPDPVVRRSGTPRTKRVRGADVHAPDPDLGRQRDVVDAFVAAARDDDLDALADPQRLRRLDLSALDA